MNREQILHLIEEESQVQRKRFQSADNFNQLKKDGLLLHPIHVGKKSYGYLDYPEFTFKVPYQQNGQLFKSGSPIEIITPTERIKALLISFDGKNGECRIYKSEFPDEINDGTIGLRIAFDEHTNEVMLNAIKNIDSNKRTASLFNKIYANLNFGLDLQKTEITAFKNENLNPSQKDAVSFFTTINPLGILQGPPGTGKTTTIIELVYQKINKDQNILISAPSNAAIDHIGIQLKNKSIDFIRLGNNSKVDEQIRSFTMEGKMEQSNLQQQIKKLRIQSDQYRKMATSYKRNFGKDERDQRKLLLQEVKNIRAHIQQLQSDFMSDSLNKTKVIIGTPVAIYDARLEYDSFDSLIIDEAAQCLDPLIWAIAPLAHQLILIGDPFQLPPTVLSNNELKTTLLDRLIKHPEAKLLNVQYRMPDVMMQYSNQVFYDNQLTSNWIEESACEYTFYDTAGSEALERIDEENGSIYNDEEINFIKLLIDKKELNAADTIIISPYSAQVSRLRTAFPSFKSTTIDGVQGQESMNVIVSLVRSNSSKNIGFLSDYRRMNVALTRSKSKLYIIGDSSTLSHDKFFKELIEFYEQNAIYDSIFTLLY